MSTFIRFATLVAAAVVGFPASGAGQERFAIPLIVDFENREFDPFHRHVAERLGGTLAGGAVVVDAASPPGNCRVSTSSLGGDGVRAAFVTVDAEAQADDATDGRLRGAGLVIRYGSEGSTSFLAFLMNGDAYEVVAFVDGDVRQRIGGSIGRPLDGPVTIAAREAAGGADFFLDGERIAGLSDSRVSRRAIGLLHCGTGRFVFDDWGLNTAGRIGRADAPARVAPETTVPDAADVASSGAATPPPLPRAEWWIERDGAPLGPITLPELRARLAEGPAGDATLVWREGMAAWTPARDALD